MYRQRRAELKGELCWGFKIKLVGTFLALSVVPLAAAFWGFSAVAERSVTSTVDDQLEAGLTAALAAFEDERLSAAPPQSGSAAIPPSDRAREPRSRRDRSAPALPPLRIEAQDGFSVEVLPPLAAEATISLVGRAPARR